MTSEIDKLKHFHVENYSGIYFTDELNAGEEFLYTTIGIEEGGFVAPLGLSKKLFRKYVEARRKLDKNQPLTASEETHLFVYLNPCYRAAYSLPKHRK